MVLGKIIVKIDGVVLDELTFDQNEWEKFDESNVTVEIERDDR